MIEQQREKRRPYLFLVLLSSAGLLVLCLVISVAQRPTRPRSSSVSREESGPSPAVRGATITVRAGGDLQKALDAAQPGDTILLEAGATFVGSFTLPYKRGSGTDADWITIRTSAPDSSLPAAGARVTPAYSNALPKIVSPGKGLSALHTEARAHHYRIIGCEFATVSSSALVYDLIALGDGSEAQSRLDLVPHHIVIDRCYVHALTAQSLKRGIALNSAETWVQNSYLSGFKQLEDDSQAICMWNGPGPYHIINNYLEAAAENLLILGSSNHIPNLIPSDIEIRRNHFSKPLSWRAVDSSFAGTAWAVKNLLELKTGKRITIDGNLFEYSWQSAQDGAAVIFACLSNGTGAAPQLEDIQFTNNVVRHAAAGVAMDGRWKEADGSYLKRVVIRNNLFEDISESWGESYGRLFKVSDATEQVTIEHNTAFNSGPCTFSAAAPNTNFVFRNNLVHGNPAGGADEGDKTIKGFFPGAVWTRNIQIDADATLYSSHRNNFFPASIKAVGFIDHKGGNYRLSPTSPYKAQGTDGTDIGCDFNALAAARGNAAGENPFR